MPDSIVITSRVCYTHHAFEEDEDGALRCLNCGGARCEACEGAGMVHFYEHADAGDIECGTDINCREECDRCKGEGVSDA